MPAFDLVIVSWCTWHNWSNGCCLPCLLCIACMLHLQHICAQIVQHKMTWYNVIQHNLAINRIILHRTYITLHYIRIDTLYHITPFNTTQHYIALSMHIHASYAMTQDNVTRHDTKRQTLQDTVRNDATLPTRHGTTQHSTMWNDRTKGNTIWSEVTWRYATWHGKT